VACLLEFGFAIATGSILVGFWPDQKPLAVAVVVLIGIAVLCQYGLRLVAP
jgi:hypothetical protein